MEAYKRIEMIAFNELEQLFPVHVISPLTGEAETGLDDYSNLCARIQSFKG